MTHISPAQLSDRDLLAETRRVVDSERRTTAELLVLLGEVDARKLFRGEGFSSLFDYCTKVLHLSEPAAFMRIAAARAARQFPTILARVANGEITLTAITRLTRYLTDDNHEALLDAARHKSKREILELVAAIDPQPDIAASVRPQPVRTPSSVQMPDIQPLDLMLSAAAPAMPTKSSVGQASSPNSPLRRMSDPDAARAVLAPLAPTRYLVKFTVGQETHDKLERARDLLRHAIPNGDPAAIVDRALTVLIEQLERTKYAKTKRPRVRASKPPSGRRVPAVVKREVWARDEGRCAFVGAQGRCPETGMLEFHHVVPFAVGGATNTDNLQLRCRSHNAHEADQFFAALSGQS